MSNTKHRYTVYNYDKSRFVVPLLSRAEAPPIGIILETGKTYTVENSVGKVYAGREPDLLYGEVIDRLAELENMVEENERAEATPGGHDDLYGDTVRRLARMGVKDTTAQIIALADECERYRAQIRQMQDFIEHLTTSRNRVTYHEREKVYREAIEVNGATTQQIVAIEELSEAQKEICKLLRDQGSMDHLAEEVADATIVLEQVRLIHGINDLVNRKMDEKVERLRRNLAAARAKKEETG